MKFPGVQSNVVSFQFHLPQAQESRSQHFSLKLRNLAPNSPPSDPGIQSPALLPQTRKPTLQPLSQHTCIFFIRTYAGSSMLGWTKWMRRDTMWKQKSPRTSPRWESWESLGTLTVDCHPQVCGFRLQAMAVWARENSEQKAVSSVPTP